MSAPEWAKNKPTWKELTSRDNFDLTDAAVRENGKDPHPQKKETETVDEYMKRIMGVYE